MRERLSRVPAAAWLLALYAMLHSWLLLFDLGHPAAWLHADRAAERMKHIGQILQYGDFRSRLAYAGQHNVPGDYIPQAILYGLGGRFLLLGVQVALCVISVACVYRLACFALGRTRRALIVASLYALLPQTLVFPHQLSAEAWFVPLTVFGFYFAARCVTSGERGVASLSGLSWACASLTRPTPLPYALIAGAALRRRMSRSAMASFLLALLVPCAGWVLWVHSATGYWSLEEGTGTTLGNNLLQRVTFISATLPRPERTEARAKYVEPSLAPDGGITIAGYLRFCGRFAGPCAAYLGHDAFNFFVKSGIEKLTIDYLGLLSDRDRRQIAGSSPTSMTGWQREFHEQGLIAALRLNLAKYPLVASISVLGALGFSVVLLLYLAGASDIVVDQVRRRSRAPDDTLRTLLAAYPIYLFLATSAAGFMESRYRAATEFAMVILAARGWEALNRDWRILAKRLPAETTGEVASQLLRFAAVGVIGFAVDVTVLYLGLSIAGLDPYAARGCSYVAAASLTWFLNRRITFADRRSEAAGTEWAKFVLLNSVGGLLNYGAYAAFIHYAGSSGLLPAMGDALGSLAGLLANFALSRQVVFRKAPRAVADSAQ